LLLLTDPGGPQTPVFGRLLSEPGRFALAGLCGVSLGQLFHGPGNRRGYTHRDTHRERHCSCAFTGVICAIMQEEGLSLACLSILLVVTSVLELEY